MFQRLIPCLGTSAVALAAFLFVTEPAAAQWRGGQKGSSWGNSGWYGGRGGYNSGGYGERGTYSNGRYSPWSEGYYSSGRYSEGYSPYYPQVYGSRYAPDAYGYDTDPSSNARDSRREDGRMAAYPPEDESAVRITVKVSPAAEIWFDGAKTTQQGSLRQFTSPPIASDRECTYDIRARWSEGGQEVDRTRTVSFHAGDRLTVNFTKRSSSDTDANEKNEGSRRSSLRNEESDRSATREQGFSQSPTTRTKNKAARVNEADATPATREQDIRPSLTAATVDEPAAKVAETSSHNGKVVSIAEDKLVMTGKDDKEHSHSLTADVKLTCDGNVCKCENIQAGMKIRVTTKNDDKHTVTQIEALDKNENFERLNK